MKKLERENRLLKEQLRDREMSTAVKYCLPEFLSADEVVNYRPNITERNKLVCELAGQI